MRLCFQGVFLGTPNFVFSHGRLTGGIRVNMHLDLKQTGDAFTKVLKMNTQRPNLCFYIYSF